MEIISFLYPQSSNAYDSLGEAYAANGDKANAIASYRRSLELDPKNSNAEKWLEKLGWKQMP
jgi:cytochrome c-type biogenesis protein CcmH/NrfG